MEARAGTPVPFNAADYVGQYGNRRVWQEGGVLKLQRTDVPNAPSLDLVPLAADYFTLRQVASGRIRFERNAAGAVARMRVRLPSGVWDTSERDEAR